MRNMAENAWAVVILVAAAMLPAAAAGQHKVAFVTLATGTGNLGDWPDAGLATGVDAGDAICRAQAEDAGLANAEDFVAWLSTSSDDAFCRVHGLPGTVSGNCGMAELPVWAGPWVRTDGFPFLTVEGILSPQVLFTPVALDQFGAWRDAHYFTACDPYGVLEDDHSTCDNWIAEDSRTVTTGHSQITVSGWSYSGYGNCAQEQALLCLEAGGPGPTLPPVAQYGAPVFVTSVQGSADLSSWPDADGATGVPAGDAICRARAAAAGIPNASSFLAWLGDNLDEPTDRFTWDGPWVRLDGVPVASSFADLADGRLFTAIDMTETRVHVYAHVMTGTDPTGNATTYHCDGWTNGTSGQASHGASNRANSWWTDWNLWDCSQTMRLYCFSQEPVLFWDGFESGSLSAWR